MAERGIEVTVFVPDLAVSSYEVSNPEPGLRVIRFNPDFCKYGSVLGYAANLSYSFAEIVRHFIATEGEPDYIEAQDYLGIAYYLQQFKLTGLLSLENTPIVITLHSPAFVYLEYNRVPTYRFPEFWTCEMEKASIRAADILISPTQFLVEEIRKYMELSAQEVHVLPNPFEVEDTETSFSFERNKIIYYGKLSAQKGSFKLLEYFDRLWRSGFPHPLLIIGGTDIVYHPEQLTMQQIVEQRYGHYIKGGMLQLGGKISASEITQRIRDAHVVLVPSIVDNLPYVVLECMARKKPVLASVQGGQREIITDKVTGFLFDHRDLESFSSRLQEILAMEDEKLKQIAHQGFESLQRYHPNVVLEKKLHLLQKLKEQRTGTGQAIFPFVHQERFEAKQATDDKSLSVVVPYYNMGKYINECIDSVLASDYPVREIIIVNDGSTDALSLQKLETLSHKKGIKVLHQSNKGLAETRNTGAAAASGRFLAFVDADDRVSASYYSKAIRILERYSNVFFVGSWVQYFENSIKVWPAYNPQPPYLLVHNPVNCGFVCEREAFLKRGLNDPALDYGLEDYDSVIGMVSGGYNGVVIPEIHYHYRVRTGSMIRKVRTEKWLYSYKYIGDKYAHYYAKFAAPVMHLLNTNGPGYTFDNPTLEAGGLHRAKYFRKVYPYLKQAANKYPFIKRTLIKAIRLTNAGK
jgi:glycosyltransferase involved in cell wall biosynthesis